MNIIQSKRLAKAATEHELANNYRHALENNDESRVEIIATEAIKRGIPAHQLRLIR